MSDALKKFEEEMNLNAERNKELEKKRKDLQEKKLFVDDYKYTRELDLIKKNESDIERLQNINVESMTEEEILDLQLKNRTYLEGAKNGMLFLNESFKKYVPFWAGNIILVGARTGGGKSTTTANLIYTTIKQINPLTGKNRKVLTISCEETPLQVYNRLTCLIRGWNYDNQDEFTDEQKQSLVDFSGKWPRDGIKVIGDDGRGATSTLEGIKSIFENLVRTGVQYDLILVDYIQKIVHSSKNPNMQQWMILKEVMNVFDYYKNIYPAAIVVMSQLSSQQSGDPENELDFQDRINGFKGILTPCTVALEMVPDFKNLKTRWHIRKNRYKGSTVGGWKDTAYDRGMFIPMTDEWARSVAAKNENKEHEDTIGKFMENKEGNKE